MKMKANLSWTVMAAFLIAVSMVLLASCEKYVYQIETVDPVEPVLFQTQIQPIFTGNCIVCHKGSRNPDLREGNSNSSLTTGGFVTLPADNSRLYKQIISGSHTSFTTDTEKQLVLIWIEQGAQNN